MTIQTRIFIGFLISKELDLHINQSDQWKEDKIQASSSLAMTDWENKKYIGQFAGCLLTYDELKKIEREARSQLQIYCPKVNVDKQPIHIFTQIFLS